MPALAKACLSFTVSASSLAHRPPELGTQPWSTRSDWKVLEDLGPPHEVGNVVLALDSSTNKP